MVPVPAMRLRLFFKLVLLFPLFAIGLPLQALALRLPLRGPARWLPVIFHRLVLRVIGVKVRIEGQFSSSRPLMILANHLSWLDILVMSSIAPVSFIAKSEVGLWPGFGTLARLQRSIFVVRAARSRTGDVNEEIATRLRDGDVMVLFAEGTTSDGTRILPLRSALLEAAFRADAAVQVLAISYPRRHGVPVTRADLPEIAWYGDMDLIPHLPDLIAEGGIEARVSLGPSRASGEFAHRKVMAQHCEIEARVMFNKVRM